ncbi:MAG: type II toxin-antitoxin system RelE/ParE family toxin [Clostridiales Family XIII bacterium]|jgi:hypothetical protein|nr:type II toxin-antitoxin system RelE/ParE family toxin [Clostridiales Family XIII bacterium]
MAHKVKVSESADRDLDEILAYIAENLANPQAAFDFADALDKKYEELKIRSCLSCHATNDLRKEDIGVSQWAIASHCIRRTKNGRK